MKPSVSKFLWAARDIDSVRTVTNSIYVCKCIPNLAYSWVLELVGKRQQKQKRREKQHIYKKNPKPKKTLNPN